jgi:hypothetical protein
MSLQPDTTTTTTPELPPRPLNAVAYATPLDVCKKTKLTGGPIAVFGVPIDRSLFVRAMRANKKPPIKWSVRFSDPKPGYVPADQKHPWANISLDVTWPDGGRAIFYGINPEAPPKARRGKASGKPCKRKTIKVIRIMDKPATEPATIGAQSVTRRTYVKNGYGVFCHITQINDQPITISCNQPADQNALNSIRFDSFEHAIEVATRLIVDEQTTTKPKKWSK